MQKRYFVFTLLACSLAACSKTPLEVMQAKNVPVCASLSEVFGDGEWPLLIHDNKEPDVLSYAISSRRQRLQRADAARKALVAAGLVLAEPVKIDVLDPAGRPTGYTDPATRYSLTDAAKPFLRTTKNEHELCWGKVSVDKILETKQHSDTSTFVEYTYKIELAEWAKNEEITNNFGRIREFLEGEGKETQRCTLTPNSPSPEEDSSLLCARPDFP